MEAFKESETIEYSSYVLIGIQYQGASLKDNKTTIANEGNIKHIELVIIKNRNGKAPNVISYTYHAAYSYFEEEESNKVMESKPRQRRGRTVHEN